MVARHPTRVVSCVVQGGGVLVEHVVVASHVLIVFPLNRHRPKPSACEYGRGSAKTLASEAETETETETAI